MIICKKSDSSLTIPVGLGVSIGPLDASLVPLEVDSSTVAQSIMPSGDGFSSVTVNPYTVESLTVDPSTMPQAILPENASAFSSVAVNPVNASIDSDIQPGNIREGVEILGVEGTFQGGTLQAKTANSSSSIQTITPDEGNFGLSSVVIWPYSTEQAILDVSQNGLYTLIPQGADALSGAEIHVNVQSVFNWIIEARKGTITDVSCYSLDGLAAYNNGASGILSGAPITTLPQLGSDTVAERGLANAFTNTSITRADISVNAGEAGLTQAFVECNSLTDASISLGGYGGARLSQTFLGCNNLMNVDISVNSYHDFDFQETFSGIQPYYTDASLNVNFYTELEGNLGSSAFWYTFQGTGRPLVVNFPSSPLNVHASNAFSHTFQYSVLSEAPWFMRQLRWIEGDYNFDAFLKGTRITELWLGVRLISGSYNFIGVCDECQDLTTLVLTDVFEQNIDGENFYDAFQNCPNLKNVTTNALAGSFPFMYPQHQVNVVSTADYIENVNLYNVCSPIYLLWQPNLTFASVLDILTKAVGATFPPLSSQMPREISFYSGGLTFTDDAQGSLQAAYDAAVQDGWTINNLTIVPNS